MTPRQRNFFGILCGGVAFALLGFLLSQELVVTLVATGVGILIGLAWAQRVVSRFGWFLVISVVSVAWIYFFLGKHGYLR